MLSKIKNSGFMFYLVCVLDFYILPLFANSVASEIIIFMVIVPVVCFIASLFYGYTLGLNWHYFCIVSLLFIPSLLFQSSSSTWIFALVIACVSYLGELLGNDFGKVMEGNDNAIVLE